MSQAVQVVGAAIVRQGRVLAARRSVSMSSPGLWEFPGGKLEPGETPAGALRREIEEELGVVVRVGQEVTCDGPRQGAAAISLRVFCCELEPGETPVPREHAELSWLAPEELPRLNWAAADVPFARALANQNI